MTPACQWTCQRATGHTNVSTWCANMQKGKPIFQLGISTYQKACQFFENSSSEMLREISIP